MLVRVVRAVLGTALLLVGLPLLLVGGLLYVATQHQHPTGGFAAELSTVTTGGYAVVASDVDELLRRDVPFARSGQTTLRLTAATAEGAPAFVGLARAADVDGYLADVRYARVTQVRLARGPLPISAVPVSGDRPPPGPPYEQSFWLASSASGTLEWSPHELRDEELALVIMAADGTAPLSVDLTARVDPRWLSSTTYGMVVLGTVVTLLAVAVLAWPGRARQVVYVVPPSQLPEVAAHLGMPVPREPGTGVAPPKADRQVGRQSAAASSAPPVPAAAVSSAPPVSTAAVSSAPLARLPAVAAPAEWPLPAVRHVTATPVAVTAEPGGAVAGAQAASLSVDMVVADAAAPQELQ